MFIILCRCSISPLAALTLLQELLKFDGDLSGKTVCITWDSMQLPTPSINYSNILLTASGPVSYACQLAKNVFKTGKVTTSLHIESPEIGRNDR